MAPEVTRTLLSKTPLALWRSLYVQWPSDMDTSRCFRLTWSLSICTSQSAARPTRNVRANR